MRGASCKTITHEGGLGWKMIELKAKDLKVFSDGLKKVKLGDKEVIHNKYILKGENIEVEYVTKEAPYTKRDTVEIKFQAMEKSQLPKKWHALMMDSGRYKLSKNGDYFIFKFKDRDEFVKLELRIEDDGDEVPFTLKEHILIKLTRLKNLDDHAREK